MDFKKKRELINSYLTKMISCKNVDEFYQYCTGLFYNINSVVFNLNSRFLDIEGEKNNVSDNRTNID